MLLRSALEFGVIKGMGDARILINILIFMTTTTIRRQSVDVIASCDPPQADTFSLLPMFEATFIP
jgi:hypothetical protein